MQTALKDKQKDGKYLSFIFFETGRSFVLALKFASFLRLNFISISQVKANSVLVSSLETLFFRLTEEIIRVKDIVTRSEVIVVHLTSSLGA